MVSNILAAASIIVAIYLYLKNKKTSVLCYKIDSKLVLDNKEYADLGGNLKISFNRKNIDKLTISDIYIWNQGNTTLDEQNIPSSDSILINVNDGDRILKADVIKASQASSKIDPVIHESRRSLSLNFKYLNSGDGAVLRVLHTSLPEDIQFSGALKGASVIDERGGKYRIKKFKRLEAICDCLTKIFFLILFLYWIISKFIPQEFVNLDFMKPPLSGSYSMILLGMFVLPTGFKWFYLWPKEKKYNVPKSIQ